MLVVVIAPCAEIMVVAGVVMVPVHGIARVRDPASVAGRVHAYCLMSVSVRAVSIVRGRDLGRVRVGCLARALVRAIAPVAAPGSVIIPVRVRGVVSFHGHVRGHAVDSASILGSVIDRARVAFVVRIITRVRAARTVLFTGIDLVIVIVR